METAEKSRLKKYGTRELLLKWGLGRALKDGGNAGWDAMDADWVIDWLYPETPRMFDWS
jgi:hypothetical protein